METERLDHIGSAEMEEDAVPCCFPCSFCSRTVPGVIWEVAGAQPVYSPSSEEVGESCGCRSVPDFQKNTIWPSSVLAAFRKDMFLRPYNLFFSV